MFLMIIVQIITFAALVFVLRKIMFSSSYQEISKLEQLNKENERRAEELRLKLKEAEELYQSKLVQAEEKEKELKRKAKEEMEGLKQQLLSDAKKEADKILQQALNSKDKIKEEIEAGLYDKGVSLAYGFIQEILSAKSQRLLQEGIVDDFVEELKGLDEGPLRSKLDKTKDSETVQLLSASDLGEACKKKIREELSLKMGKEIILEESIDKKLIAGLIIKSGGMMLDASLSGKLREAAEKFKT